MPSHDKRLELYAFPQRLVDIGGRRINVCLSGKGSPTVIMAPGMGGSTINWVRVQRRLESSFQVMSYDRAGLGFSDPGPMPRTSTNIVGDLRAVLSALKIAPPYVLVGHSAGSFDVRLFAFQHPEEVAGMVLVDPSTEWQVERFAQITGRGKALNDAAQSLYLRCEAAAAAGALTPGSAAHAECVWPPDPSLPDSVNAATRARCLTPDLWRTLYSENFSFFDGESSGQLRAASRKLGAMPLIVLTAGKLDWGREPDEAEKLYGIWRELHEDLAALSSRGVRREVQNAGHGIQVERPDVVADAIREVIALAGASTERQNVKSPMLKPVL